MRESGEKSGENQERNMENNLGRNPERSWGEILSQRERGVTRAGIGGLQSRVRMGGEKLCCPLALPSNLPLQHHNLADDDEILVRLL